MPFDPVAVSVCPVEHIECIREVEVKIRYGMTSAADKMIMTACIGIEVIDAIPEPEPGNLSQISEQRQIPIYGTEADVGEFSSQRVVNDICGRVITARHKEVLDSLPLAAVFQGRHL